MHPQYSDNRLLLAAASSCCWWWDDLRTPFHPKMIMIEICNFRLFCVKYSLIGARRRAHNHLLTFGCFSAAIDHSSHNIVMNLMRRRMDFPPKPYLQFHSLIPSAEFQGQSWHLSFASRTATFCFVYSPNIARVYAIIPTTHARLFTSAATPSLCGRNTRYFIQQFGLRTRARSNCSGRGAHSEVVMVKK